MGRLKKIYSMRLDALVIYVFFTLMIIVLYTMFDFAKAFFSVYETAQRVFTIGQLLCIGLVFALFVMMYLQYQTCGKVAFYQHGLVNTKTAEQFLYRDIVQYEFIPQNNKTARSLAFKTDDGRIGELSALLPRSAFVLFQEEHSAVWAPFMIEQIQKGKRFAICIQEDTTSFRIAMRPTQDSQLLTLSNEGIEIYDVFYTWASLSRYQVSWHGMFSLKDTDNKTVFFEPSTSLENYHLLLCLLDYFLPNIEEVKEDNHE